MCLIALAHGVSARFPLIVAANRDEHYARPTRIAHLWEEAPNVVGGRDLRQGGSWLAISAEGRLAAVTNLHGGERPDAKSRGLLVRDFVVGEDDPLLYARGIDKDEYAGFHLVAGIAGGTFAHLSGTARELPRGIFGVSNGPPEARWEKIELAERRMRDAMSIHDVDALAHDLLTFLGTPTHRGAQDREVFVAADFYGTRSSTVILATGDEIHFFEQNWSRGGVREGEVVRFRLSRAPAAAR